MAYTTDRTWVDAEVPTAALFHTYLRDNMKWLSTDKPMFKGGNTTGQSITSSVADDFDMTSESFDNTSMHSTSTLPERVTIVTAGKYLFGAVIVFGSNASGVRKATATLNGTTPIAESTALSGSTVFGPTFTTLYALAAADYVTCTAFQNSGSSLTIGGATQSTVAWVMWVGV